jgi:hypothetical protein
MVQERINRLQTLSTGHRPVDAEVRANLANWAGADVPDCIALRVGYLRRLASLAKDVDYMPEQLVDRPKPVLPKPPQLATLVPLTKGVALQQSLTLPFLVQTAPRKALTKDALLKIPIEAPNDHQFGLVDLVAVPSVHRPSRESTFASNVRNNRKRQIRSALDQLDALGLVELPSGGRKGAPRFNSVRLKEDTRPRAAGARPYTVPTASANVVLLPSEFFLNGWIHALSKSEIAMWLMLRDLAQRSDRASVPDKLHIRARDRLLEYDLSRAVWDTHASLEEFGLIAVHKDPNRRPNGTTVDGERADPHYFELRDERLKEDGLTTVLEVLAARPRRS